MKLDDHKHLRVRRAREKHDAKPLVQCPRCGLWTRSLQQHTAVRHTGRSK